MSAVTLGKLEILGLFKDNTLKFFDALIELFPEESELIVKRILFENQIPIEDSMVILSKLINRPLVITDQDGKKREATCKELIEARNDRFFLTDNNLFSGMSQEKLIRWRSLWTSSRLDKQDREQIWKWMTLFLNLSEMYCKHIGKN